MPQVDHWLLLDTGASPYDFNMALDESLLEQAPLVGRPVLRFYAWIESAASFGYSQRIADIERATHLRPLVRRPTGGGLVPHDRDWTYSVAVPPSHAWYALRANESYERVHRWLQLSFAKLGVTTELAPFSRTEAPGQCFAGHEQRDLLWFGRKIAGAAQRRTRTGLLIQGSVQPPPGATDRAAWQRAMTAAAHAEWQITFDAASMPESIAARAELLRDAKYSRDSHNRKR